MKRKRLLALCLSTVMALSAFTSTAMAAEISPTNVNDVLGFMKRTSATGITPLIPVVKPGGVINSVTFERTTLPGDVLDMATYIKPDFTSSTALVKVSSKIYGKDMNGNENYKFDGLPHEVITSGQALSLYLAVGLNNIAVETEDIATSTSALATYPIIRELGPLSAQNFLINGTAPTLSGTDRYQKATIEVPAQTESIKFAYTPNYGVVNIRYGYTFSNRNSDLTDESIHWVRNSPEEDWSEGTLYFEDSSADFAHYGNSGATRYIEMEFIDQFNENNTFTYKFDVIRRANVSLVANPDYTYIPRKTSSSSSSSSSSTTPTSATTSTTTTPTTTTTKADTTIASLLKADKDLELTISGTSVTVTGSTLADVVEAKKPLMIRSGDVTVVLTPAMIEAAGLDDGKIIKFEITPDAKAPTTGVLAVAEVNKKLAADAVKVTVTVDGRNVDKFNPANMVRIDLSKYKLTDAEKAKITGVSYLKNGDVKNLGGRWISDNVFEFSVDSTGTYGALVSNNVIKIVTTIGKKSYTLGGDQKDLDAAPMIMNNSTMIPIRFVAEALGANVSWNDASKTASIGYDNNATMRLTLDQEISGMGIAPVIVSGRMFVPLRYVSEKLDGTVYWDGATKTITIYK